ncbi:MAG: hypothetical protein HOE30_03215 [Deltaproteobacteria bacterium]|nr:hypothetical protein [Deltaproteobacteria bacterium]MBT4269068.1 hypothetical protein [Deltaproteobacteria bacterium]MBT4638110.1 hypothetical protein [Deltaproteobacteria bacterium]MBT6500020.1 hypothetical protein [Deltaproteobacteria bacterium]MBT6612557.1 hypothetical protein [Deltaproteobacteria bacterium]
MAELKKYRFCRKKFLIVTSILFLLLLPQRNSLLGNTERGGANIKGRNFLGHFQQPVLRRKHLHPDVILIPEEKGWLISILLPYIAPGSNRTPLPDLFVVPETPSLTCDRFLSSFKNRKVLSFISPERIHKDYQIQFSNLEYFGISHIPFEAAFQLAEAFTSRSPEIVLTTMKNPEQFFHTAIFAGQLGIPFIPFRNQIERNALRSFIAKRKVQKVYQVSADKSQADRFHPGIPVIPLTLDLVVRYTVLNIGEKNIRNIITTRLMHQNPRSRLLDRDMIHFVPYISLLRNAPLVVLKSKDGLAYEREVTAFIDKYHIRPRTITVVGDYNLLSPIKIEDDLEEQIYNHKHKLERELLSRPEGDNAFPYGVGRLPFSRLPCISMYYARLAKLRKIRTTRLPEFTMIANLDSDKRARLMLAESVSRSTVLELRNLHLKGSEHYGNSPADSRIWQAALKSDLLIYEGHIEQFSLIKKIGSNKDPYKGFKTPLFNRFPFLVLQSCHSLENAELLLNQGVSGIVGSCSKIHSASGSAFIKSYFDAMLYEKANTGEALRDAKNYALSLVKLKCARGHLEQDKTMRVALSFRLVGDPEVELFTGRLPLPVKQRLSASFVDQRTIEISTPPAFYPLVETEGYQLKLFPGSETAGIVSRSQNDLASVRKIHTFHFFRLDIPPHRSEDQFVFSDCQKNTARNISLKDPFNRWLYVLHYPRVEAADSRILLEFE